MRAVQHPVEWWCYNLKCSITCPVVQVRVFGGGDLLNPLGHCCATGIQGYLIGHSKLYCHLGVVLQMNYPGFMPYLKGKTCIQTDYKGES